MGEKTVYIFSGVLSALCVLLILIGGIYGRDLSFLTPPNWIFLFVSIISFVIYFRERSSGKSGFVGSIICSISSFGFLLLFGMNFMSKGIRGLTVSGTGLDMALILWPVLILFFFGFILLLIGLFKKTD